MHRNAFLALILLVCVTSAVAQDVLTLGTGEAAAGGVVSIPVSIRDVAGTPLGIDASSGNRIQGFAFKVLFPTEIVASMSFARAGVTASLTPLHQTALQGSGWSAALVSFNESSNLISFGLDAAAPGDLVGTLSVTLSVTAPAGSTAMLRLDPPSAMLSNQAGSVRETVANGTLSLVNGSVRVTGSLATPAGFSATAAGTSQVNVVWLGVGGAANYQVWRSSNGGAFAHAATASGTTYTDLNVAANMTYLYKVRATDGSGGSSAFTGIDPATTIVFTDDPLVAHTTSIKALHLTELRTAVNAMRGAAGFLPLGADATVGAGQLVRAAHVTDLRNSLASSRARAGLSALTLTDATLTVGTTTVKAAHVQELRDAVK